MLRIMRAGRGLGVILHAEHGMTAVAKALQRLVVEIHVRELDLALRERIRVNCETVIVRGNLHLAGDAVEHGLVGAAVAELQLVGLPAEREAEDLVAEADAEHGYLADQSTHLSGLELERLGIPGPIGEEHSIGIARQDFLRGGQRGDDGDAAAHMDETTQDVALDPEVVRHDVETRLGRSVDGLRRRASLHRLRPGVGFLGGDARGQIEAGHRRTASGPCDQLIVGGAGGGQHAAHDALVSQVAHQRARVDLGNHRDVVGGEELLGVLIRAPVAGDGGELAYNQPLDVRPGRFAVLGGRAIVADLRVGEDDDLPGVGGVGEDFLVSGDGGVEDDLAAPLGARTKSAALEDRPVLQGKNCLVQLDGPPEAGVTPIETQNGVTRRRRQGRA
jgi:hypothetical protein